MRILIVEQDSGLAQIWARHIARDGAEVTLAASTTGARTALKCAKYDALVIDLSLPDMSALEVAELAAHLQPRAPVIYVTPDDELPDSALYTLSSTAKAYLPNRTRPEDLARVVAYHAASS